MSGKLIQLAVVLIVLWTKTDSALQKKSVPGAVQNARIKIQPRSNDQYQDEIVIPAYELEENAIVEEHLTRELSYETARTHSVKQRMTTAKAKSKNDAPSRTRRHYSTSLRNIHEGVRAMPKRTKRKIFHTDNRVYISRRYTQKFPFNATVKISTGCTGTLVSPLHVLTSAHCIHSGEAYEPGFVNLSVGFLQRNASLKWVPVSRTHMPHNWTSGQDPYASKFDYAILKLSKRHYEGFIPITLSEGHTYGSGQRIQFSAFEDDKPANTMWYRKCSIVNVTRNMLFHCCDAKPGSSGAGVYVYFFDNKTSSGVRKVIGVFSGNRNVYNRPDWSQCPRYWYQRYDANNYNAAIRINSVNFKQMCKWMGKYGGEDCIRVKLEEKRRKRRIRKRRNRHGRRNGRPRNAAKSQRNKQPIN